MKESYHQPVLLTESMDALRILEDGVYADVTFGGGGHSCAILERLGAKGRLISFDQDADAWRNAPSDPRFTLVTENFRHLQRFLKLHNALPVNGILADLGVSSHQFDTPKRGFSTRYDGDLDMRMDLRGKRTASSLINEASEAELHRIFEQFGEISNAKTLARHIAEARKAFPIRRIAELKAIMDPLVKGNPQRYLAQVFQALRIAVNDELDALKEMLRQASEVLAPGGRLVVITFHSLEDRLVKQFMRSGTLGVEDLETSSDEVSLIHNLKPVYKKPLVASREEQRLNPRSRSAKLRAAEKKY